MTLTLDLSPELLNQLNELARQRRQTLEEISVQALHHFVVDEDSTAKWSSDAVRAATLQVIEADKELLRRLAQ